jgi:hypothetical protein
MMYTITRTMYLLIYTVRETRQERDVLIKETRLQ